MHLAPIDGLIIAIYGVFVLGVGFVLRRRIVHSADFFLAGRAFIGAQVVLAAEPSHAVGGDRHIGGKGGALSLAAVGAVAELDGGQGLLHLKPDRPAKA